MTRFFRKIVVSLVAVTALLFAFQADGATYYWNLPSGESDQDN